MIPHYTSLRSFNTFMLFHRVACWNHTGTSTCSTRPTSSPRIGQPTQRTRCTSPPRRRTIHLSSNTGTFGFLASCPSTSTLMPSRFRCVVALPNHDAALSPQGFVRTRICVPSAISGEPAWVIIPRVEDKTRLNIFFPLLHFAKTLNHGGSHPSLSPASLFSCPISWMPNRAVSYPFPCCSPYFCVVPAAHRLSSLTTSVTTFINTSGSTVRAPL